MLLHNILNSRSFLNMSIVAFGIIGKHNEPVYLHSATMIGGDGGDNDNDDEGIESEVNSK